MFIRSAFLSFPSPDFAYCRFLTKIPYTLISGERTPGYSCCQREIAATGGRAGFNNAKAIAMS